MHIGAAAVEWFVKEYGLKSRKEAVVLGEQLRQVGVFSRRDETSRPFMDDQHALYKFGEIIGCTLTNGSHLTWTESDDNAGPSFTFFETNERTAGSSGHSRNRSSGAIDSVDLMSDDGTCKTSLSASTDGLDSNSTRQQAQNQPSPQQQNLVNNVVQIRNVHIQSKGHQSAKFLSLTKRERERFSELVAEWDASTTNTKKKDGIIKNIRGRVKTMGSKIGGFEDDDLLPPYKREATTPVKSVAANSSGTHLSTTRPLLLIKG